MVDDADAGEAGFPLRQEGGGKGAADAAAVEAEDAEGFVLARLAPAKGEKSELGEDTRQEAGDVGRLG